MTILSIFKQSLLITYFVFVMMILIDFINMATKGQASRLMQGGHWRQYTLASFLGATPGCLGAFMNVTLYVHAMISFGAVVGGMIATSGDEAFVMLAQFPGTAILLFGILFAMGIFFAWIADKLIKILGYTPCKTCRAGDCQECLDEKADDQQLARIFNLKNICINIKSISFTRFLLFMLVGSFVALVLTSAIGNGDWTLKSISFLALSLYAFYICMVATEHYLQRHIWDHIVKKHLFRVFLWTFGALIFVQWGLSFWNLEAIVREHMIWVLLTGALVGIIPESGPHLIFVMLYAQGVVPFSVLLTSSFVQDGHGMLPLLSYSIKDSFLIKVFNLVFGLAVGIALYSLGL